jgi:hypothetical protein
VYFCPRGITWLPLEVLSWNFIFEYFVDVCRENSNFIIIWEQYRLPRLMHNGYWVSFPGVKRPVSDVNQQPRISAEVKERVELYLYSPSGLPWPVVGRNFLTFFKRRNDEGSEVAYSGVEREGCEFRMLESTFSQLGAVWRHPDSHPKATDQQTSQVFPSDRQGDTTFCRHVWNSSLFVFCFSKSRWKFNEHIFHLVSQLLVIIIRTLNFQFEFCILFRAAVSARHSLDSDKTRKNLRFHYACCNFFGD